MAKITKRKGCMLLGAAALLVFGCSRIGTGERPSPQEEKKPDLVIMHVDADSAQFRSYIEQVSEKLDMDIRVMSYPANADSRQAKVSTLLSAEDPQVDVFSLNDEMVSAFKSQDVLEPLEGDVMAPDVAAVFPKQYVEQMLTYDGHIYSAPYMMDILLPWVNQRWLEEAGLPDISTRERFLEFLSHDWGEGRYAYGGSWEKSYAYNEIGEFVGLFGGDWRDWSNEHTREAVSFLKDCVDQGRMPVEALMDQYEQMNQKFIDGKYGMVFMYSGELPVYIQAGVCGPDFIHAAAFPQLGSQVTYMAAWQYAINRGSAHKEEAKRFLAYAVSREGARLYAETMNRIPVRLDLMEENLQIAGFEEIKQCITNVELQPRPIPQNSVDYIVSVGTLFRSYLIGELELDGYCGQMDQLIEDSSLDK